MTIAGSMTRCPRPFDAERADEAAGLFSGLAPELAGLVRGAAGCSPYLHSLMEKEREWLPAALDAPDEALARERADLGETPPDRMADALRRGKRRFSLALALADLSGAWPLERITATLTDFADLATSLALRATIGAEISRGKLPGVGEEQLGEAGGMFVLAMGKMGAWELNYSSDIDLICLFDEDRFERDDFAEARASFVRATKRMAAMLSDPTAQGYVFRTDLRLRPDPSVTPVCMATGAAEAYYESVGRTWERGAYIKARTCAGCVEAGDRFLATLSPFVWRRHLDFAAIEDAHDMRLLIRKHKALSADISLPGHDMKLGRGGIREIEFFTQTRQLISGGRDPDLRVRGTEEGLARLAQKGWVAQDTADLLTERYRSHREVEHRLQMVRDAQTQKLPTSDEEFDRLAAFMDMDRADMERDLLGRLTEVHELIESFFRQDGRAAAPAEIADSLDQEVISRWTTYPALRSERAVEIFERLKPDVLSGLAQATQPEEALKAFDEFLSGLPAGVQLFAMFEANPQLVDLLLDVVGTAPSLARHLSRNSSVFEAVIAEDFFSVWPGREEISNRLAAHLEAKGGDYEKLLDEVRIWCKEMHFRIGVHHLRGLVKGEEAAEQYADLAQAVVAALWPLAQRNFAERHGPPPGRGGAVVGLGSLGASMLHARSDLDLVVLYDADPDAFSDGAKPLEVPTYYARLTRAFVTALTAPTAVGKMYDVDMRLRPSGNHGPVATSWSAFQSYQRNSAWVWEHLALSRARVIAGPQDLAAETEAFRLELMGLKGEADIVLEGVAEMRQRILEAKTPAGVWDPKIGPGRMQEIELTANAGAVIAAEPSRTVAAGLRAGVRVGFLSEEDMAALESAYMLCWRLMLASRLLGEGAVNPNELGRSAVAFVLRETGRDSVSDLARDIQEEVAKSKEVIDRLLDGRAKSNAS